jgi:hypothetical protein
VLAIRVHSLGLSSSVTRGEQSDRVAEWQTHTMASVDTDNYLSLFLQPLHI